MDEAVKEARIFVTATGNKKIIRPYHFDQVRSLSKIPFIYLFGQRGHIKPLFWNQSEFCYLLVDDCH